MNVSGITQGFAVSRKLLTSVKGSNLEAMFSGRHNLEEIDGNAFIDRDADIFKHVITYLRNDRMDLEIQDPFQKKLFDAEVKYWDLNNMNERLDEKLVKMLVGATVFEFNYPRRMYYHQSLILIQK